MDELHGDELEAALLEPANDVADESALDAVGLQMTSGRETRSAVSGGTAGTAVRTLTMM